MPTSDRETGIFRFLFRLVSRAPDLSAHELLGRLAVGIANRYGAESCSICRFGPQRQTVWAAPGPAGARACRGAPWT